MELPPRKLGRPSQAARDAEIARRIAAGDDPAAVAAEYGISRKRLNGIYAEQRRKAVG